MISFRESGSRTEAGGIANAGDIKLLSAAALRPALDELLPQFEESSGYRAMVAYGSAGALTNRMRKGEAADVAIVSGSQIDELKKLGKVLAGTRVDIARIGIGVFGRKSARKIDIGSVDAFRRSVLAAKAIAYPDPAGGGPAGIYVHDLLDRLGIAAEVKTRTRLFPPGPLVYESVAAGHAEIGFEQISLILEQPSVELIGPLPATIQRYTLFAAAVGAASNQIEAGKALISFLASAAAAGRMEASGFELL
jgi:molybdate transport system substrate-binding protein